MGYERVHCFWHYKSLTSACHFASYSGCITGPKATLRCRLFGAIENTLEAPDRCSSTQCWFQALAYRQLWGWLRGERPMMTTNSLIAGPFLRTKRLRGLHCWLCHYNLGGHTMRAFPPGHFSRRASLSGLQCLIRGLRPPPKGGTEIEKPRQENVFAACARMTGRGNPFVDKYLPRYLAWNRSRRAIKKLARFNFFLEYSTVVV